MSDYDALLPVPGCSSWWVGTRTAGESQQGDQPAQWTMMDFTCSDEDADRLAAELDPHANSLEILMLRGRLPA
jgi:hypothetical protein